MNIKKILIIFFVIVVVWYIFFKDKESFQPSNTDRNPDAYSFSTPPWEISNLSNWIRSG